MTKGVTLNPNEVALVTVHDMEDLRMVIPDEVEAREDAPQAVVFLAACAAKWRHDQQFVTQMIEEFWRTEERRHMH